MSRIVHLKSAELLDRWLETYNPLKGATLGTLSGFFEEADQGRFTHVMWMARRMARRDGVIRACLKRIDSTIMKLEWRVKIMGQLPEGVTQAQATEQQLYLKQRYEQLENLKAAYGFLARADFAGFAHLEKHYNAEGQVTRLEPVPQWHWCRQSLYGPWLYNPSARPWPNLNSLKEIDERDFVIMEESEPWLEIALVSGLDRNQLRRDLRGYCARYGIPNTFFIAGSGATEDDMDSLNGIASGMVADGTGVLPPGATVETAESSSKGEIFDAADKAYKSEIVMAATGGLLTMLTESGSGTLAGGAHSDSWHELVSGLAARISEVFQDQMDKAWLAERFPGQPVAVYFALDFPEAPKDVAAVVESVTKLKTAGFNAVPKWVTEETGVPFTESVTPENPELRIPKVPARLLNRFQGGPTSARDRAEAESLVSAAVADALGVASATLSAPLAPSIQRLIAALEDDRTTAADFLSLAEEVQGLLPELVTADGVRELATSIESALGTAAALGARASLRKRAAGKGAQSTEN